ncbi:MAG: hypothetical protein ACK4SE_03260 [Brevundimonas sp.]
MNPAAGERADGVRKASLVGGPSEPTTARERLETAIEEAIGVLDALDADPDDELDADCEPEAGI